MAPPPVSPLKQGLRAARANAVPGLVLQGVALAILLGYLYVEPVTELFRWIAQQKVRFGYGFAIVSTCLFGGVIPALVQRARARRDPTIPRPPMLFFTLFWAFKGFEIDLLYNVQARVFGDSAALGVIVPKVLADQFLYVPLWAVPSIVLAYLWKDHGYDLRRTAAALGPAWYRRRILPVLLANWGVWIPAVIIIYCLPLPLQLPMQNLVLCMFALMILLLTDPREQPVPTGAQDAPTQDAPREAAHHAPDAATETAR